MQAGDYIASVSVEALFTPPQVSLLATGAELFAITSSHEDALCGDSGWLCRTYFIAAKRSLNAALLDGMQIEVSATNPESSRRIVFRQLLQQR